MSGYSIKEVSRMADLPSGQVRAFTAAGLVRPTRGTQGEWRYSFQDLVLLRAAKGLADSRISPRKIRDALACLKTQLPDDRPLSGLQLRACGDEIVVQHEGSSWNPLSGQALFEFDADEAADKVAAHAMPAEEAPDDDPAALDFEEDLEAEDWYGIGLDLEAAAPDHARDAYRRALELDPDHVDSRVNLGRLLHDGGQLAAAEANYRVVLEQHPEHPTALFNLAVALDDQARADEAIEAYRKTVRVDPRCADAFYNLARLLEARGDQPGALRCLQSYRRLRRE